MLELELELELELVLVVVLVVVLVLTEARVVFLLPGVAKLASIALS
jgi:hypothetical protein